MLFSYAIVFCLCWKFSLQNIDQLALEQGLSDEEVEIIREHEKIHRFRRQLSKNTYKSIFGFPQTIICGINGNSISRTKRDYTEGIQFPQGSEDLPWMALFLDAKTMDWFCGGSLINNRYILTAAHCFNTRTTEEEIIVRLGEYYIKDSEETKKQDFGVEKIMKHLEYDKSIHQHDIAVLKLNRTVEYTQYIRPICLASEDPAENEITIVSGWGLIESNGPKSLRLLYVLLPVWNLQACRNILPTTDIFDTNICAGAYGGGKDSCNGDSGGPLIYKGKDNRWVIVGIVSWGKICGSEMPGVYTSVSKYLKWIETMVTDGSP